MVGVGWANTPGATGPLAVRFGVGKESTEGVGQAMSEPKQLTAGGLDSLFKEMKWPGLSNNEMASIRNHIAWQDAEIARLAKGKP